MVCSWKLRVEVLRSIYLGTSWLLVARMRQLGGFRTRVRSNYRNSGSRLCFSAWCVYLVLNKIIPVLRSFAMAARSRSRSPLLPVCFARRSQPLCFSGAPAELCRAEIYRAHYHVCACQSRVEDAVDCLREVDGSVGVEREAGRIFPIFSEHIETLVAKASQCLREVNEELQTALSYIKQSHHHAELALELHSNE